MSTSLLQDDGGGALMVLCAAERDAERGCEGGDGADDQGRGPAAQAQGEGAESLR